MDLYLMRHGEAEDETVNPQRPLTAGGRATIARIAAAAAAAGMRVDRIYHSGILRAQESAEILATHLRAQDRVEARQGLAPPDPVEPAIRALLDDATAKNLQAVAIVGHLPFLDSLAARLVNGDESASVVVFDTGSLAKLVPGRGRGGFAVAWLLSAELAD
jgi:phosphohistidine phosphatase